MYVRRGHKSRNHALGFGATLGFGVVLRSQMMSTQVGTVRTVQRELQNRQDFKTNFPRAKIVRLFLSRSFGSDSQAKFVGLVADWSMTATQPGKLNGLSQL